VPRTPPGAAWVGGFSASVVASAMLGPPENAPGSTGTSASAAAAAAATTRPTTTRLRPPRAARPAPRRRSTCARSRAGAPARPGTQGVPGNDPALDDT